MIGTNYAITSRVYRLKIKFMAAPDINSSSPISIFSTPTSTPSSVKALIFDTKWGTQGLGTGASIYYSFPTTNANWLWGEKYVINGTSEIYNNFNPLREDQIAAARDALEKWSNVANLNFIEVTNEASNSVGDIRIANTSGGGMSLYTYAYAYVPFASPSKRGDIWFNNQQPVSTGNDYSIGENGYLTMLHELGHALGLDHPFDAITLPTDIDHYQYTVMSYSSAAGVFNDGFRDFYPTTPMLLDIQAIQYLYGANMSHNAGDDLYLFGDHYAYETIWDAGGTDTIQYSGSNSATINLNSGSFSSMGIPFSKGGTSNASQSNGERIKGVVGDIIRGSTNSQLIPIDLENNISIQSDTSIASNNFNNVAIAFNVTIENAVGGDNDDTIIGNAANNNIDGGGGNDTYISNYNRSNVTIEKTGDTSYIISSHQDVDTLTNIEYIQFANETTQEISSVITEFSPPEFLVNINGRSSLIAPSQYSGPVSYLQYQQIGSESNEIVVGSATNDFINLLGGDDAADGGAGNDVLDGGTGSNFLTGGSGSDVFFIDGRGAHTTWSTVTDFTGDSINIWGWNEGVSKILLQKELDGAEGYQGVTLHMDLNADNIIDTSITFTGLSSSAITNRQSLSIQDNGYLFIG